MEKEETIDVNKLKILRWEYHLSTEAWMVLMNVSKSVSQR